MAKNARRFRTLIKRFLPEKPVETGPRLRCPSCLQWMDRLNQPKSYRESKSSPLVHYMCPCGVVSHWFCDMVPHSVGYGRYRKDSDGLYRPRRLSHHDCLWLCPERSVAYFFKDRLLVPFGLNELPPSITGRYTFRLLEKGTVIHHKGENLIYNGFAFVRRGNTTRLQVEGIHCEATYLDTTTHHR